MAGGSYGTYGNQALSPITSVAELIQGNPGKDVATFVSGLPLPHLSSPTFVYRSQSLQRASYESPRALLSDAAGKLVLAFHGGPSETIEAMEFDDSQARFRFYEITFSSGKPLASAPNPAKCLHCHRGPDPRPNWESYDHWPGVYGSNDDRLAENEVAPFLTFLKGADERPRYGALKLDPLKKVLGYTSFFGRLPEEPNISFTHRLSQNNYRRVARLITESHDYAKYKYLIAAFLSGNDGPRFRSENFLPTGSPPLDNYFSAEQVGEAKALAGAITVNADVPTALAFRSLFESRGIDTSDWFMNFSGGLTTTFINGVSWEAQLLEALMDRDPSLQTFRYLGSTLQLDESRLAEASYEALRLDPRPTRQSYSSDTQVPRRLWNTSCRQCHEGREATVAPQFSFESAIRSTRLSSLIESGAMPPNRQLAPSEKRALLRHAQETSAQIVQRESE